MLMQSLTLSPAQVQPIQKKLYQHRKLRCAVLRIDSLHPVVSGNKWFKLKGFLQAVADERKKGVITFGGPWSNHLLATAAACAAAGVSSIGLVRGLPPPQLSPTLTDAQNYGMQLHFLSRENYRRQELPAALAEQYRAEEWCMVPEGGYGRAGAWGAREILQHLPLADYTHILCAVGTGTTLAGLVLAAGPSQSVVGITVLKNADTIASEVGALLDAGKNNFRILHDYHFGGYAKKTAALLQFMNQWYLETGIPSDFVYTAKMFFAADALAASGYFPEGSSILLVHTGGLQGNRSLPKGTLIF